VETRLKLLGRHVTCVVALVLTTGVSAVPSAQVRDEAAKLYWWGDFPGLLKLHEKVARPGQWVADKGTALGEFREGLFDSMGGRKDAPDAFFVAQAEQTLAWTREYPQSALAHVLHAQALSQHAWWHRGGGYSDSVSREAWADFERYQQLALDHLVKHRDVAFQISDGHRLLIAIGRSMSWDFERLWGIAQDGLKIYPEDIGLYLNVMIGVLPKWRGSPQAVDRFVNLAADHAGTLGPELYSRLYSAAAEEQFDHKLFDESGVEWPRLQAGFEALLKRQPSTVWRNRYAYMACLARDKAVFLDQMERIGSAVERNRWGSNPTRMLETCRRWAALQ
jgi:hypothetical protein